MEIKIILSQKKFFYNSAAVTNNIFGYFIKINKFLYGFYNIKDKLKKPSYLVSIYKIVRDKGAVYIFKQKFGCRN